GQGGEREHGDVDGGSGPAYAGRHRTRRRRAARFRHVRALLSLTALHRLCRTCVRSHMTSALHRTTAARAVTRLSLAILCLAIVSVPASAQARGAAQPAAAAATDEGIPVDSAVVKARCGSCHRSDDKGRMSRISYRRATAENWELTIKRM